MKFKPLQLMPLWLSGLAIAVVLAGQYFATVHPQLDLGQRLEWLTYDWRVRQASRHAAPTTDRLGFLFISDETIAVFSEGKLGTNYQFGLYWPRHLYGQVLRELRAQGAEWVGLDVLFGERRRDYDHWQVSTPTGFLPSDTFFQSEIELAGNAILGASPEVPPHRMFRGVAADLGDITIELDADGVLRRVRTFRDYRIWHEAIRLEAWLNGWDLNTAEVRTNAVLFRTSEGRSAEISLSDGLFDPAALAGPQTPGKVHLLHPPFEDVRVWHLGLAMAARALGLDLSAAEVRLDEGTITLPGTNGVRRVLPVDGEGRLLIDWVMRINAPGLVQESFETMVAHDIRRQHGAEPPARFKNKLVLVGSIASGNELSDRGPTPTERHAFLTINHWNVANSILMDRFIKPPAGWLAGILIVSLGTMAAAATWKLRPLTASAAVLAMAGAYGALCCWFFIAHRCWVPMVMPLAGVVVTHVVVLSYRAFFENNEQRRIRHIFSKLVSPNVVQELLKAKKLLLGGARREVTVFFADVRGFTELIDQHQAKAEEEIRQRQLAGAEAAACIDAQARDVLQTVNLYLGAIADIIKKHDGTLDKYIGDCVMAFWGAPTPNEQHALSAVRAAIDAQNTIYALNQQRHAKNKKREQENAARAARGEPVLPLLPLLTLGTGINTGVVTVGLMGSDAHLYSYTIFGRDVNLASRLETVSGRGRILIGESTFKALQKHDPMLAAACIELPPVSVKGIRAAVKVFEVSWKKQPPAVGLVKSDAREPGSTRAAVP